MQIASKITMSAKPLGRWYGNPPGGVTTIYINQRKSKLEKDQIGIFHSWKIV